MKHAAMRYIGITCVLMLVSACGGPAHSHVTAGREGIVGLPCEACETVSNGPPSARASHARSAMPDRPGEPMRIEGTVTAPDGRAAPGATEPGSTWIAFDTGRDGDEGLDVMRPDRSEVRNESQHPARGHYSRGSPDRQRLLLISNRDRDGNAVQTTTLDGATDERIFRAARSGQDDAQLLKAYVASQFRDDEPGGVVLVASGERPLLKSAYGLADVQARRVMTIAQPLPIGSITKSFTAAAILSLVRTGEVMLGDDVREHVPGAPVGERIVTIEQLLTHTSGMPNLVDVPGFLDWGREPRSTNELLARTEGIPFHFEPGTGFAYSDTGYILLGAVLERYHKGTWSDAVRDLVARPVGLASVASAERLLGDSAAIGYTYDGPEFAVAQPIDWSVPHASGSLVATADDLLTWVRGWRAGVVATPELSQRAWAARTLPDGTRSGYGFGWKRCDFEGRTAIQHGGWVPGFTASVLHLPDEDLTAIALLNSTDRVEASYLTRRALRLLLTGSAELPLQVLTQEQRANLVGRYRTVSGDSWTVIAQENGLVLDLAGQRVALAALSTTKLCAADSDGTWCFTFEPGPDGAAASLAVSLTCEPQGKARREMTGVASLQPRAANARSNNGMQSTALRAAADAER